MCIGPTKIHNSQNSLNLKTKSHLGFVTITSTIKSGHTFNSTFIQERNKQERRNA
jgi:hypothetical protein